MIELREDATGIIAEAEKLEKILGDNPASILYSDTWEKARSYTQIVMEIEEQADDFLFSLAGHKGETIDTLRRKTVSELNSFYERIVSNNKQDG